MAPAATAMSTNGGAAATRGRAAASSPLAAKEISSSSEKLELIEETTRNVDAVQERVLADILARNAESEYLAKCGLAAGAGRAAFRAKVPMATYEDLKPYILRIANGDTSPVLTGSGNPVSEFFFSSGTSGGEPKLIPVVQDELDRRRLLHSLAAAVMNRFVPGLDKGKGLYFLFARSETKTPSGLPARTIHTSYYKSCHFQTPADDMYSRCTSPRAAILCVDTSQSMYAQMVCGLCQRHDVLRVGAVFASSLVRAIRFLQHNWERLAADIEAGELGPASGVSDPSVRDAVAAVLRRPDPKLARLLRAECSKPQPDCWAGIITRLWPNAKYLDTIATGSMAQYVPALEYYGGGLPIASTWYACSECSALGLNLRPLLRDDPASYTILPSMAYLEFLPVDATDATSRDLVELAGVEAGREYEIVVTTYGGLNRYRVGDVLRVAGFHNTAPTFRFVGRRNALLSIDADKTGEAELQRASAALLRPHGAAVLDYTSRACTESIPGHYVIYWELLALSTTHQGGGGVDGGVLDRCCLEMEEALSYVYRVLRVDGSIAPLEIRVVRAGTFEELADFAASHGGASMGQYKVPRCVSVPAIVRLLDSCVVSTHFSPSLPHRKPVLRFETHSSA